MQHCRRNMSCSFKQIYGNYLPTTVKCRHYVRVKLIFFTNQKERSNSNKKRQNFQNHPDKIKL